MSDVTTHEALPIETMEHVLATGDISKLTPKQKVAYYVRTCESLGLNPLTRPFRFLKLNNQEQLYATRDCTDQLRQLRGINLQIVEKKIEAGVLIVTARAQTKDGRHDEDVGAVTLPQGGESRANAMMKAITKAKRRVTLSICGLGMSDESELDTVPGAYTYDPNDPAPVIDADATPPPTARDRLNAEVPLAAPPQQPRRTEAQRDQQAAAAYPPTPPPVRTDDQWHTWLGKLRASLAVLKTRQEVVQVGERDSVGGALGTGPDWVRREISAALAEAYARCPEEPDDERADEPVEDELPPISGERYLAG